MPAEKLKVAIIGAGITGLYLAWKLSKGGYPVTVFEKRERIGKECCSGLFSERILEFIPQAKNLIEAEYNSCLIHFPRKTIKINFKKKVFFIEHSKLDNLVFELAKNSGAEILFNRNMDELPDDFDRIIGCDGPLSFVRRKLNLANPLFYSGIQKFVSRETKNQNVSRETFSEKVSRETLETWPVKDGFLWKIPKNDTTEYGIMAPPLKAEHLFQEFIHQRKPSQILQGKTWEGKSALIPRGLIIPKNPKITLCGDAAGLTKPWTGGGVIWGLTAAEILLKNFPDFLAYQKEARKFFLSQIIFSKTVKKIVYFLGFNFPWLLPKKAKVDNDFLGI